MEYRDLTIKDMEGIEFKGKNRFDVLVATAERAKEILEKQEADQTQKTNPYNTTSPERKRDRSAVTIADTEGEGSSAAAAKRKKCNALNIKNKTVANGLPPPPLPEAFKNVVQELAQGKNISQEILVIQKGLFETDVSKNHNRLSIPINQTNDDFLTTEEKDYLCTHDENNKKNYMEVKIIAPLLERETVKFGRWDMPKNKGKTSSCYVINGRWKHIVERNKLRVGMVVQLWGFRMDEELCFALVRLR